MVHSVANRSQLAQFQHLWVYGLGGKKLVRTSFNIQRCEIFFGDYIRQCMDLLAFMGFMNGEGI